jgi:hypothetical protein
MDVEHGTKIGANLVHLEKQTESPFGATLNAFIDSIGHERTFHTQMRHVRFPAGTRPHEAIG